MQISIIWDVYNSKSSLDCKGKLKSEKDDQEAGIFKNKKQITKKACRNRLFTIPNKPFYDPAEKVSRSFILKIFFRGIRHFFLTALQSEATDCI